MRTTRWLTKWIVCLLFVGTTAGQPGRWNPTGTIEPDPSIEASSFGRMVAVSDDLLAVSRGVSFGTLGTTPARLDLYDFATRKHLGMFDFGPKNRLGITTSSLLFHEDRLIVGGRRVRGNGFGLGGVYIFDIATRSIIRIVEPPAVLTPNASFGSKIALGEDFAVVGAPRDGRDGIESGAAFVYSLPEWTLIGELEPDDTGLPGTDRSGHAFGTSVATLPGIIAVSSVEDDLQGSLVDAGRVYLFDPVSLHQVGSLRSVAPRNRGFFGFRIFAESGLLYVSEPGWNPTGMLTGTLGAVNVYEPIPPEPPRLLRRIIGPSNTRPISSNLSINDHLMVVQMGGAGLGLFDLRSGARLGITSVPSETFALFPDLLSVSIDGSSVVVGAPFDDRFVENGGIVFTYDTRDFCIPDIEPPFDGPDIFDFAEFIARYNNAVVEADLAAPFGTLDFFDIAEYIRLFTAGCP